MNINEFFTSSLLKKRKKIYTTYWDSIKPSSPQAIHNRWLFAFLSVHTTWSANVKAYQLLKNKAWASNEDLQKKLVESGVGLYNIRTKAISNFDNLFKDSPNLFNRESFSSWEEMRDTLNTNLYGLGLAKISFALEMVYPLEIELTCLDVHMLKAYGKTTRFTYMSNKGKQGYIEMEQDWVSRCKASKIAPSVARSLYWDILQNQTSPKYWTHVLETD